MPVFGVNQTDYGNQVKRSMKKNELNSIDFLSKYDPYELTVYDGMTLTRHHVFSAYNKAEREDGDSVLSADHALLHQYKGVRVDTNSAMGVDIELKFYHRFRRSLQLVPALDCGDHTDFVGIAKGKLVRFDVTKNRNNKRAADYTLRNQYVVEWSNEGRREKWEFYRVTPTRFMLERVVPEK